MSPFRTWPPPRQPSGGVLSDTGGKCDVVGECGARDMAGDAICFGGVAGEHVTRDMFFEYALYVSVVRPATMADAIG